MDEPRTDGQYADAFAPFRLGETAYEAYVCPLGGTVHGCRVVALQAGNAGDDEDCSRLILAKRCAEGDAGELQRMSYIDVDLGISGVLRVIPKV